MLCEQVRTGLEMAFMDLYVDLSPFTLSNGSIIVSTVIRLQSQVNVTDYTNQLISNLYSVFLGAGFLLDNSSISMNSLLYKRIVESSKDLLQGCKRLQSVYCLSVCSYIDHFCCTFTFGDFIYFVHSVYCYK